MNIVTSMSGLGRIEKCPTSCIIGKNTGEPNPYSEKGLALHRYLALVPEVGRDAALLLIEDDYREACAIVELERLPLGLGIWAVEVGWALNWRTGTARELGRNLGRNYEVDRTCELPGAADVTGTTPTHAIVLDYKSGWADQGTPANSWQLRTYALAAARAYGKDSAFVGFIRLRDDGSPWFDCVELGPLELDAHEVAVRELMLKTEAAAEQLRATPGGLLDTHEGGWCKLCPAFANCPAKVALAAAIANPDAVLPGRLFEDHLRTLDETSVPKVLARLDAVDQVTKRMRKALREYGLYRTVPLGDGTFYGAVDVHTESVDVEHGGRVIAELFGASVADEATKMEQSMPWGELEEALRSVLAKEKESDPKASMAALIRKAREGLRAVPGALIEKDRVDVKVFKPAKNAKSVKKKPPELPPAAAPTREPGEEG